MAESGEHAVVKGLKQNKKAMIAIAKEITFRGVKLPYLFLDEDSRTHYVGDDTDVWVIVAGNCAQVIEALKEQQCIAGWVAMRINDEDSLGNYLLPTSLGCSLTIRYQVAAISCRRCQPRQRTVMPGSPSALRPKNPPSWAIQRIT